MGVHVRGVFAADYQVEEAELPAAGASVKEYPARGQRSGALLLRFTTKHGSWIGDFHGGYRSSGSFTGVVSTPNPSRPAVVVAGNGVLVDTRDPERYEQLDVFPVTDAIEDVEGGLVLFADFSRVCAYDTNGKRWTADLRADGIRVEHVGPDGIVFAIHRAPTFREENVTLSRQDGSVVLGKHGDGT